VADFLILLVRNRVTSGSPTTERTSWGDQRRPAEASAPLRVSGSYPGLSAKIAGIV